ncbi:MAG: leucine-rich repeat protein [Muribaculaceae bacterium]|nr:leucine-rich repeat protein [Muribaculaceae bacterium]
MKNIALKLRFVLFTVSVVLSLCLHCYAFDFSVNGIYYNINSATGSAEVTSGYNSYSGIVFIPSSVQNEGVTYAVTAVGDNAFKSCESLQAVVLGPNISRIGKRAFLNCSQLTSIEIPAAVTVIDSYAFAQCSGLQDITFQNTDAIEIGPGAFMRCSQLTSVEWESFLRLDGNGGITSLATNAFAQCTSLESILLPGELGYLGTTIFDGCHNLSSITVTREHPLLVTGDPFALASSSVTISVPSSGNEGETAALYSNAVGWRDYNIAELPYSMVDNEQYTYIKTSSSTVAINGCLNNSNKNIVVKNSIKDSSGKTYNVTSVADEAFKGSVIKSFDSSNAHKLKVLGQESFANCKQLNNVKLREGINSMGERVFAGCTALTSIKLPSTLCTIPSGAFKKCYSLADVTVTTGVTTICENAFEQCTSLETINLPISLHQVESDAFKNTTSLRAINVDPQCQQYASFDGVLYERKFGEEFGTHEKKKMNKLVAYPVNRAAEDLYIPCGVTIIMDRAFKGASNLKHVTIPSSTTIFGDNCFDGTSIETINYRNSSPTNEGTSGITESLKSNATLQVPVGTASTYHSLNAWNGFKNIVETDNIYQDTEFAYDWNAKDEATIVNVFNSAINSSGTITIPNSVTMSGYTFFVTELKNNSTQQVCETVKEIIIASDSLSTIDTSNDINPITACQQLQHISVSSNNPYFTVSNEVLYNKQGNELYCYLPCNTQNHFTIPSSVETVIPQAFAYNKYLTHITLGNRVVKIMGSAFEGITTLQLVDNAKNLSLIGRRAFAECSSLKNIKGGEHLNTIEDEAFLNCHNLKGFPFAHGMLQSIGNRSFMGCSSLATIVLGLNFNEMGDEAFKNCTSLKKVFFSTDVKKFGQKAFMGCTSLGQVWLNNNTPPSVDSQFFAQSGFGTAKLFVPNDDLALYGNTSPWNTASEIKPSVYLYNAADVNSDNIVNALDVTLIMSVLLGDLEGDIVGHCDVNRDGVISALDITLIYDVILNSSNTLMAYNFVNSDRSSIESKIYLNDDHPRIVAVNHTNEQMMTSGLSGYSDNTSIAILSSGVSPQGTPYLEIIPVTTGYFTLVGILKAGNTYYYRAYPLTVLE